MTAETVHLPCPICGEAVEAQPVTRVDVERDAELVDQLVSARLNKVSCPVCGHSGVVPEPVIVHSRSGGRTVGYVPVDVPSNRKGRLAERLQKDAAERAGRRGQIVVCFGPAQLRHELPDLPWSGRTAAFCRRFDDAGPARHRESTARRALKARPDDAALLSLRGNALYELRKFREARKVLARAIELAPAHADALHCLASVSLDAGKPEDAMRLYDRVVGLTHDAVPRFLAGVAAHRAGHHQAARERIEQALKDRPDLVDAYIWLAIVWLKMGSRAAALNALRGAVAYGLTSADRVLAHAEFQELARDNAFKQIISSMRRRNEKRTARPERSDGHSRGADGDAHDSHRRADYRRGRGAARPPGQGARR